MPKYLKLALIFIISTIIVVGAITISKEPKTNLAWLPEYQKTATVDTATSSVTIRNVRDWTYTNTVLSQDWIDVTVDPNTVTSAWFIVEPFGGNEAMGHTFLSFEFADNTFLSFSVQARQETNEDYSAFEGAVNEYELAYQWGTERDFIARRLLFLKHDIRLYQLDISSDDAQRLFRAVLEETNTLANEPRFYNTFTANCTNLLAKSVNKHYPHRLPYDISWNLTGYSDFYLMDQGLIENSNGHEAARTAADLTPYRELINTVATTSPKEFSATIRKLIDK